MKKSLLFISCLSLVSLAGCSSTITDYLPSAITDYLPFLSSSKNEKTTVAKYNISFLDDSGNLLESVTVNEGEMPVYSKGTPTKEDTESTKFTFNKWIPEIKAATADAEYRASFNSELNKYTVTFDSDGGTPVESQIVEWGKTLKNVAKPTKQETDANTYTFSYWYDTNGSDSTAFNMSTIIKRDYALKAKWAEEIKSYTITFESNGGSKVQNQKVNYNEKPVKPNDPTHDDSVSKTYTFGGWYLNSDFSGDEYDFNQYLTSNITLYAKWIEETKKCTVSFYSGTELFYSTEVDYGSKVTAPLTNPTRVKDEVGEYDFDHWDFDFDTVITGDTTINAVYNINYIYYHYTQLESSCLKNGCKEFWGTKADEYSMVLPTEYCEIIEVGQATDEIVAEILANNPEDERILPLEHLFDDVTGECVYGCGTKSITSLAIDISKLSVTDDYAIPYEYGQLYKYDGYAKDVFTDYNIEGLTRIKFYIVSPASNNSFILCGEPDECNGAIFDGGDVVKDGIIAEKVENEWIVTRASGAKMADGAWKSQDSYTVTATKLNEVFDTFTYDSYMYFSDIIVEGTLSIQKSVVNNAIFTGEYNSNVYELTNTGEKVLGHGNKYNYSCVTSTGTATYFRKLFNDIDITSYSSVEFYIDISGAGGNYITFADDNGKDDSTSGAYGLHALDGANTPGVIKAYNEGNGTWRVTSIGLNFRAVSNGAKVNTFTYTNRTTLGDLFKIGTANSWHKNTIKISDVIATK